MRRIARTSARRPTELWLIGRVIPFAVQLKWHLSHVRGYLELGMLAEAAAEFDQVSSEDREDSEALKVAVALFHEQSNWPKARNAAAELCRREPGAAAWWIAFAYATRRAESIASAEKILLAAAKLHPDEATISFNLGCYACQRGDLQASREYVSKATSLDAHFRAMALSDPDLAALRASELGLPE